MLRNCSGPKNPLRENKLIKKKSLIWTEKPMNQIIYACSKHKIDAYAQVVGEVSFLKRSPRFLKKARVPGELPAQSQPQPILQFREHVDWQIHDSHSLVAKWISTEMWQDKLQAFFVHTWRTWSQIQSVRFLAIPQGNESRCHRGTHNAGTPRPHSGTTSGGNIILTSLLHYRPNTLLLTACMTRFKYVKHKKWFWGLMNMAKTSWCPERQQTHFQF